MATERYIKTKFWADDYIVHLNSFEKLLFLYFLTNPFTEICGVYELPLSQIEHDTGISPKKIIKTLIKFEKDDKIYYEKGWIAIKNFARNQKNSPKIQIGIEEGLKRAPKALSDRVSYSISGPDSLSYLIESNLIKKNLIEPASNEARDRGGMRRIREIIQDKK